VTNEKILEVLKAQHHALDSLMARLIELDVGFYPSRSGHIWDAVQAGHALIQEMQSEKKPCTPVRSDGT